MVNDSPVCLGVVYHWNYIYDTVHNGNLHLVHHLVSAQHGAVGDVGALLGAAHGPVGEGGVFHQVSPQPPPRY